MALKVSKNLIEHVKNSGYDKKTQDFIIQALRLEFKREKEDVTHYFRNYDNLIESFLE
ncbi:hypothetical protein [Methanobrevibacter sp.]|uniref:hypothetical protein n=1 Tax=Methanobrevibacter sp. TaxID=66852 RepID=UPI00386514AD